MLHEEFPLTHVVRARVRPVGECGVALKLADVQGACACVVCSLCVRVRVRVHSLTRAHTAALDATPPVRFVSLELPQREGGGVLPTLADLRAISKLCRQRKVRAGVLRAYRVRVCVVTTSTHAHHRYICIATARAYGSVRPATTSSWRR
jgi:hypothetical protein